MKRIILLAALLLAASACSTTTQAPGNTNATTPANSAATPKAEATAPSSDITAQEKQIWDTIKQKNPDAFAAMLADDFVYVSIDGMYDKAGTVEGIKQLDLTDLTFSDWKTLSLDKDATLVTYTVNMKGTSGGKPLEATALRAASVWVNRGGKWVGVFHQETEVEQPPADMESRTPQAQATPQAGAKPPEPASDDPVAREKQVWDAIKKKDYDRFASFLADDQIEVFAWGVNDKAESVEGVKKANLGSAMLSDFKATKLSDNAQLVTYMVKGSGGDLTPTGERSSSIWVNRGGKWLAVYHQGTAVKPAPKSK